MSETSIGLRIKQAREAAGLSQQQLARQSGIGVRQTITDIEGGSRHVKAAELLGLSRVLRVDVDYLLRPRIEAEPRVLWRGRPTDADAKQTTFMSLYQRYQQVLECSGGESKSQLPDEKVDFSSFSFQDASAMATDIGKRLGLGSRPASELPALMESDWDVLIWFLGLDEGSAACVRTDTGAAVLVNSEEVPWRRNFDLAHELFHLVTWSSTIQAVENAPEDEPKIESLANVFASTLLMPSDEVTNELKNRSSAGGVDYPELVSLAREFAVSTEALIWRLVTLRFITPSTARTVLADAEFRRVDRASWNSTWFQAPPLPEHFVRTAFLAYSRGCLSRSLLAKYLDTSLVDLEASLDEYGYTESGGFLAFSEGTEVPNGLEGGSSTLCLA